GGAATSSSSIPASCERHGGVFVGGALFAAAFVDALAFGESSSEALDLLDRGSRRQHVGGGRQHGSIGLSTGLTGRGELRLDGGQPSIECAPVFGVDPFGCGSGTLRHRLVPQVFEVLVQGSRTGRGLLAASELDDPLV